MRPVTQLAPLILILVLLAACAKAPPTLSPAGTAAFQATRVVKALDVLRDVAISANEQSPPLLSTATTRKVVLYHRSAVTVLGTAPEGWREVVGTGLSELHQSLSPAEQRQLDPYIRLVQTLIEEVMR